MLGLDPTGQVRESVRDFASGLTDETMRRDALARRVLEDRALGEVRLPCDALTEVVLDLSDAVAVFDGPLPAIDYHATQGQFAVVMSAD